MRATLSVVLLVAMLGASPGVARADLASGLAAYEAGEFAAALAELLPLAEAGEAEAQFVLGALYADGNGVPQDREQAAKWYRLAVEQGHVQALTNLAKFDKTGAIAAMHVAAEAGDMQSQFTLGAMYAAGRGVLPSFKQAVKWYRLAGEQGHVGAQFELGSLFDRGLDVAPDWEEAVVWYRLAAEQGHERAQFNLGYMYKEGQSVEQDGAEAVKWFRLAALQGNIRALNYLGIMYTNGEGVAQDLVQGYVNFARAAAQGNEKAAENRDVVAGYLTPEQLVEAKSLVSE